MEKGPYTPRRKYPWGTRRCGFAGSKLLSYVESLENHNNAVDGTFYDAIVLFGWSQISKRLFDLIDDVVQIEHIFDAKPPGPHRRTIRTVLFFKNARADLELGCTVIIGIYRQ